LLPGPNFLEVTYRLCCTPGTLFRNPNSDRFSCYIALSWFMPSQEQDFQQVYIYMLQDLPGDSHETSRACYFHRRC
jgi:hypothetical protein